MSQSEWRKLIREIKILPCLRKCHGDTDQEEENESCQVHFQH